MKRTILFAVAILAIAVLNGCVVHSIEPFFTPDNKIEMPEAIIGEWQPMTLEGDDVSGKDLNSWKFSSGSILCYDETNLSGEIDIAFFKVNNELFCDTLAGSPDSTVMNQYWIYHLYPFHILFKVIPEDDTLTFIPLNRAWMEEKIKSGEINVSFVESKSDNYRLFIASSERWEGFIKKYANDPVAFSKEHKFFFKRKKAE